MTAEREGVICAQRLATKSTKSVMGAGVRNEID